MDSLIKLFAILSLFISSQTFADTTSYDNRRAGSFGVGAGLGYYISPIAGTSLSAQYSVSRNLQIELRSSNGELEGSDLVSDYSSVYVSRLKLSDSLHEIRARYFVGNSFYLAAGLGQRSITIDIDATDFMSHIGGSLNSQSTCIQLGLGNIWTLDSGLYLGGEWLALSVPFASRSNNDFEVQSFQSGDVAQLKRDTEGVMDRLGKSTTGGIATFIIGYQF